MVRNLESKGTVGLFINLLIVTSAILCCIGINWRVTLQLLLHLYVSCIT
jgi:hypothetical protein